ncbi:cytidylyltransferase domain-containing protein [Salisaeta longa]|uniref:cytidylyltransferase domain-containing protein n=1 Tax=Salisaeta longa TaxID=503170 RepID=UPI00146F2B4E|nr:glycosyltransferase family protein [Salisaeta longa]
METDMNIVAVIQARMGSTRLPGKVLRDIAGRPMIDWVVRRARRISSVDQVVVATSVLDKEKPLIEHLESQQIPFIRGSESDVLERYVDAAEAYDADAVVRITSDCPLLMPDVSENVIQTFVETSCDYAANTIERTYPRGLDTEVISCSALRRVHSMASDPADREHVTRYIRKHSEDFALCSVTANNNRAGLRWTVDEEEDLILVRRIYEMLGAKTETASYEDVVRLVETHDGLASINQHVEQKSC